MTAAQPVQPQPRSQGEKLESLAFQFCKVATVALICQRFTLPIAGLLASGLFVAAYMKGKKETRCFLGPPLMVASFWIAVTAVWVYLNYFRGAPVL